jgi:hypothetical protein
VRALRGRAGRGRVPDHGLPLRAGRHGPVAVAAPIPVRVRDHPARASAPALHTTVHKTHRHWPATNLSSAQRPYVSAVQPSTPVPGTTPSFPITRMLSPESSQFSTMPLVSWGAQGRRGQEGRTLELDVRAERREPADDEALVLRDVVGRERPAGGEGAEIERSKHYARVSVAIIGQRDSGESAPLSTTTSCVAST